MKIAIGNDHAAVAMKEDIAAYLRERGHEVIDCGTDTAQRVDYPVYGLKAAKCVTSGEADCGIVICGTGIGISLAANKVPGIRAAVCSEPVSARLAKEHNNANILAFGARIVGLETAKAIVDAYLDAEFLGGRHADRVALITRIENGDMDLQ